MPHLCACGPERITQWRRDAMGYIGRLSAKFEPGRIKWIAPLRLRMPIQCVRVSRRFRHLRSPDSKGSDLVKDIAVGVPISGDIWAWRTPNSEPRGRGRDLRDLVRPAAIWTLLRSPAWRRRRTRGRMMGSYPICVAVGGISAPIPLTDAIDNDTGLAPRYLIGGNLGGGSPNSELPSALGHRA